MLNFLKHFSLIWSIVIVAIISFSMSSCHCKVLQPNDLGLIEETCKKTPNTTLCLQLLKAAPAAPSANVTDLALIMGDAMIDTAFLATKKIIQLIGGGWPTRYLADCYYSYRKIWNGTVPEAIDDLKHGNPKAAEDATRNVTLGVTACRNSFPHGITPLDNENNALVNVVNVASAIINMLL